MCLQNWNQLITVKTALANCFLLNIAYLLSPTLKSFKPFNKQCLNLLVLIIAKQLSELSFAAHVILKNKADQRWLVFQTHTFVWNEPHFGWNLCNQLRMSVRVRWSSCIKFIKKYLFNINNPTVECGAALNWFLNWLSVDNLML